MVWWFFECLDFFPSLRWRLFFYVLLDFMLLVTSRLKNSSLSLGLFTLKCFLNYFLGWPIDIISHNTLCFVQKFLAILAFYFCHKILTAQHLNWNRDYILRRDRTIQTFLHIFSEETSRISTKSFLKSSLFQFSWKVPWPSSCSPSVPSWTSLNEVFLSFSNDQALHVFFMRNWLQKS